MFSFLRTAYRFSITLSALVVACVIPALAYAATYYVAKDGSNNYTCNQAKSVSTPKFTVAAGIACMSSGDTLVVKAGIYAEAITGSSFNGRNGTSAARTKVIGDNGAKWTLRPNGACTTAGRVIYLSDDSWIEMADFIIDAVNCSAGITLNENSTDNYFHHFEVKDWAGTGSVSQGISFDVGRQPLTHRNHIAHCYVHATNPPPGDTLSHGIYPTGEDNIVEHCTITGAAGHGIHQHTQSSQVNHRNIYRFNFIQGNGAQGIGIYNGAANEVYGNILVGNGHGIRMGTSGSSAAADRTKIYNNTIYSNGSCVVITHPATDNVEIKNNVCVANTNNGLSDSGTGTVSSNNHFTTDETVFINASQGQFSPRAGSVLIDAGTTIGLPTGVSYFGSAPDQGAMEFVGGPNAPTNLQLISNK